MGPVLKEIQLSDLDFVLKATMTEPWAKGGDQLGWILNIHFDASTQVIFRSTLILLRFGHSVWAAHGFEQR